MSIGTQIKKIRKDREITQEQLAEYLNISPQAVSHWECDRSAPDIMQIPLLCRVLNVTSDELLCIDIQQKEAEIQKKRDDIVKTYHESGKFKEAYLAYVELLSQYPDSFEIMYDIADEIDFIFLHESITENEKTALFQKQGKYLSKVAESNCNPIIRNFAITSLAKWYYKNGDKDKANKVLSNQPMIIDSKERLKVALSDGDQKICNSKSLIVTLFWYFLMEINRNYQKDDGKPFYSAEELCKIRHKQISFIETMFEEKDFGYYNNILYDSYYHIAFFEASRGNREATVESVKKAIFYVERFLEFLSGDPIVNTSLILRGYIDNPKNIVIASDENDASWLLNQLNQGVFDFVRDDKEFCNAVEQLKRLK